MSLARWNDPFAGLSNMHSQLDDIFNSLLSSPLSTQHAPAMDVYTEDGKNLVVEAQIPGFGKNDIEVNVHEGVLEIKGGRHEKTEDKDKKRSYMMRESHASFYRSIVLPKQADADKVKATFEEGVLKVRVPFKELPTPKKIAITASEGKKESGSGKK